MAVSRLWARRLASVAAQPLATETTLFTPSEAHGALRNVVRAWTREHVEPQALAFNRVEQFNRSLLERMGSELGMLGPTVDEAYGGAGLDATAACVICEELSYSDPAFCLSYMAHSILFVHNLYTNGSDAQRLKFLPSCVEGKTVGAMAMSEARGGTDVLSMTTTAREDGSHFILNGSKMWITNGCVDDDTLGDCVLVYAKTGDAVSLFVVEKGTQGFSLGQRIKDKCGMRASPTAELVFEDCRVPRENLVGTGLAPMMRNLEIERLVLAAMSTGIARRCIDAMRNYAARREAFGSTLSSFGQIQSHVAESYAAWSAARSYLYHVAAGHGTRRVDSDGVKLFAAKMATTVADRAIQVHGGNGYVADYVVERLWRDAKLLEIGGGTLESHHKNITNDLIRFYDDRDLPH